MSAWICLPQRLVVPDIFDVAGVWICRQTNRFALASSSAVVIVGASNLFPSVRIDGQTLALEAPSYHGHAVFDAGAYGAFFHSVVRDKWIFNPNGLAEPRSILEPDTEEEVGDGWYEASSWSFDPFASSFDAVELTAKGTASGSVSVEVVWPHWRKQGGYESAYVTPLGGSYSPLCGASGTVLIGAAAWRRGADSAIFVHRSGGSYAAPATGAEIVPASDIDEEDETGDYVFSDAPRWRLRELPSDGSNIAYYTLAGDTYTRAGYLYSISAKCVPRLPSVPSGVLPYSAGLLVASPPQWK